MLSAAAHRRHGAPPRVDALRRHRDSPGGAGLPGPCRSKGRVGSCPGGTSASARLGTASGLSSWTPSGSSVASRRRESRDRGIELVLETGSRPMPRTRPIKRLSAGERAELRRGLHDLLDRGWLQHSTAGHAASMTAARVLTRKPDGSWRICCDCRGLNAITESRVEPLPHWHMDARGPPRRDAWRLAPPAGSPSSTSPRATIRCDRGRPTGGRAASAPGSASSSERSCPSACKGRRQSRFSCT